MCHGSVSLIGFTAFFLAGLAGGLHCLGMCAPLSSLFWTPRESSWAVWLPYHGFRLVAYAGMGFVLSLLGIKLGGAGFFSPVLWLISLPLLLVLIGRPLQPPRIVLVWESRLLGRVRTRYLKSAILGFFTPLLPCGLLYAVLASSLAVPSPVMAAGWMLAFGLGTIPVLFLGQMGIKTFAGKLKNIQYVWLKRSLAAVALVFVWYFHLG